MSVQTRNEESKSETKADEGEKSNCLITDVSDNNEDVVDLLYWLQPWDFYRLFIWSAMLLLAFGLGRLLCIGHGNYEFCRTQLQSDVFDNLSALLLMGIALCFFTGVHSSIRFNYLYGFNANTGYSGVLFLLTFVLTPVVWKGLNTTALSSLAFTARGMSNNVVPLAFTIVLFLFTVCWHIYTAYQLGVLRVYLVSRCLVFVYLILSILLCLNEPDIQIHVHHYQLGWLVALLGCFNHPISLITLSFGAGLFVEGLATFGADSMFVPVE